MCTADMMPALHNYVTVDPQAFLSDPKRMEMIYDICKTVLTWSPYLVSLFEKKISHR